jgi:peptidyl-tRNA hydrolase
VRAFVPSATDDVAAEIAKLQVTGLELDDVYTRVNELCATEHITVSVCPEPKLSTGKAAAACGHAAQVARKKMAEQDPERFERWRQARWAVVVEPVATEEFEVLRAHAQVVIVDAGFTEIDPNTTTAVAYW